jgi:hypothetical protein
MNQSVSGIKEKWFGFKEKWKIEIWNIKGITILFNSWIKIEICINLFYLFCVKYVVFRNYWNQQVLISLKCYLFITNIADLTGLIWNMHLKLLFIHYRRSLRSLCGKPDRVPGLYGCAQEEWIGVGFSWCAQRGSVWQGSGVFAQAWVGAKSALRYEDSWVKFLEYIVN